MNTEVTLAPAVQQAIINGIVEQLLEKIDNKEFVSAREIHTPPIIDEVLDVPGAAELLKVKIRWVREQITRNQIPFFKAGRNIRFKRSELDKYMYQNRCLLLRLGAY